MNAIGILGTSSESFLSMQTYLNFDEKTKKHTLLKLMNIAIRCTYYIFYRRSKSGTNPKLLNFYITFLLSYVGLTVLCFWLLVANLFHCKLSGTCILQDVFIYEL